MRLRQILAFCFVSVFVVFVTAETEPAYAGEQVRKTIRIILGEKPVRADMFAESFLAQVPLAQLQPIITQIRASIGAPVEVRGHGNLYVVRTKTHTMPVTIALDNTGKITGLLFKPATQTGLKASDIRKSLQGLGVDVAYLVTRDKSPLYQHNANKKLAVGSAFKLAILSALKEKIESGKANWADVVKLEANQVSLPSGMLHELPVGSPLTLHTLAALMISISDNTATDVLLDFVSREAVAAKLGTDFVLKTRELFILKASPDLRKRFFAAGNSDRMTLVKKMAALPLPETAKVTGQHIRGLEYYITLNRLCALMAEVSMLDVMSINPGLATPQDWRHIAFKGGSEQGVLNFTTQVTGKKGVPICIAFTWNAAHALETTKAASLYTALINSQR